jgi:hypothetical protein
LTIILPETSPLATAAPPLRATKSASSEITVAGCFRRFTVKPLRFLVRSH